VKYLPVATLLAASIFPGSTPGAERFGVAASDGTTACAAVAGIKPRLPSPVEVIVPGAAQRALPGTLTTSISRPCGALASRDLAGPFFSLGLKPGDRLQPGELGIVRLKTNGAAPVSRRALEFRACASAEGMHLAVWEGAPVRGRRLWHEYVYFGLDFEPDCSPRDVE